MKFNTLAKLGLATSMVFGAMSPMMMSIHAEEAAPIVATDGMYDTHNVENLKPELKEDLYYNGKEQTQKVKIMDGDYELVEGTDYKLKNNKAKDFGEYELTIIGINDYHGETTLKFEINEPINIRQTNITFGPSLVENGQNQKQEITVSYNGETLEEGKDYTVEGNIANKAGTYDMSVSGINKFGGSITLGYTVAENQPKVVDIKNTQMTFGAQLVENGKDQKQTITVTYNGQTLKEGTDYTVAGNVANKAGSYQMTVTGINGFTGTQTLTYTVQAAPVQKVNMKDVNVELVNKLTANKKDQKQEIKVTYKDKVLEEGKDYTVEGNTVKEAGSYTLTIKGAGNYEGTKEVKFTVAAAKEEKKDDKKEDKKEEKQETTSNTGLIAGLGIGAVGALAGVLAYLKFRK